MPFRPTPNTTVTRTRILFPVCLPGRSSALRRRRAVSACAHPRNWLRSARCEAVRLRDSSSRVRARRINCLLTVLDLALGRSITASKAATVQSRPAQAEEAAVQGRSRILVRDLARARGNRVFDRLWKNRRRVIRRMKCRNSNRFNINHQRNHSRRISTDRIR